MKTSGREGHRPVRAYQEVKTLILRGELPPGSKLSHRHLSSLLGMSTTPIREALARLAQEGYAHQVPNAGFFVQQLGLEESAELYDACTSFTEELRRFSLAEMLPAFGAVLGIDEVVSELDAHARAEALRT